MRKSLSLVSMELKYLLRQRFLWILIIVGTALAAYQAPRFRQEFDYSVFTNYNAEHSTEGMSEAEKASVEYWQYKLDSTLEKRNALYERALAEEKNLEKKSGFRWEYIKAIEKLYGKEIKLEAQDYLGWEIVLLQRTSMLPHNFCLLHIIIIVSAGLLLMTKDKENGTLFWASITGRGSELPAYLLRIAAVFLYGLCLQIFFTAVSVLFCCFCGLDMGNWLNLVQNVAQYGMCDLQLSILGLLSLDIVLKCVVSLMIFLFVFLWARIVKRYIFLFLGGICISGILYYALYVMCENKNYGFLWRINPLSVLQLDRFLTYHAANIANHAVDIRLLGLFLWLLILGGLVPLTFKIWRTYLYAYES